MDTPQILEEKVIECHSYYLQIYDWKIPIKNKARIFGDLVPHANPVCWRIIGVTKDAVGVFSEYDFKKASKMGVNRGHLVDRNETCNYLFTNRIEDPWEFWSYYYERDKTVLMTASENISGNHSEIFDVPDHLFLSSGFAWKHRKEEVNFLKELHSQIF